MAKARNLDFQLKAIDVLRISIDNETVFKKKVDNYSFEINIKHNISREEKLLLVICDIIIKGGDESESKLGNIVTCCTYNILNLDSFYDLKNEQYDFPENALWTLNSISISTTRGLMYSSFSGTILKNVLLPVFDSKSLYIKNRDEK